MKKTIVLAVLMAVTGAASAESRPAVKPEELGCSHFYVNRELREYFPSPSGDANLEVFCSGDGWSLRLPHITIDDSGQLNISPEAATDGQLVDFRGKYSGYLRPLKEEEGAAIRKVTNIQYRYYLRVVSADQNESYVMLGVKFSLNQ